MRRRNSWAIVLAFCCLLSAQEQDSDGRLSNASVAASEVQTKKILREVRHLGNHDWAGEYYFGDGLGVNVTLALAPENGFVFRWHGCLGTYDLNYGDVTFTQGTVKLGFKYPNRRRGFEGIAPEFLPVQWGPRHYLIPVEDMIRFTNAINAGTEPNPVGRRSFYFLLRRGDEKKTVEGVPTIPPEYLSYILREPLRAAISSITESRIEKSRRITRITVNVGSADGLKKGMELFVKKPSTIYGEALVTDVGEHWASAVIEQDSKSEPAPSPGWLLSTKL
jgi:hypothetical protein